MYIFIYLFIHSVCIYICSVCIYEYMCIYIYVCVYMYIYICVNLCLFFKYIHIYICICIYKCVCVGGVVSKWGVLLSSQRTLFGTKKRHLVLRHIHVYTIYLFVDMCFLFLSCVGLSHPKNMFSGFLLYVVFSASFYRKNVSNQKMFHWRLQYR